MSRSSAAAGMAGLACAQELLRADAKVTVFVRSRGPGGRLATRRHGDLAFDHGLSLDEAAEKLGIKRNTVRAHLRAIFSKAGVTRQSELVRILLNGVLGLSSSEK